MATIKHILVPTDGSELSTKAAVWAGSLARATGARVSLVTVLSEEAVLPSAWAALGGEIAGLGDSSVESIRSEMQSQAENEQLATTRDALGDMSEPVEASVHWGHAATVVCEYADANNVDLIVMGSHGRSGIKAALLGSVSHGVLHRAACPVTVVR